VPGTGKRQPNLMLFLVGSVDLTNETLYYVVLISISPKTSVRIVK